MTDLWNKIFHTFEYLLFFFFYLLKIITNKIIFFYKKKNKSPKDLRLKIVRSTNTRDGEPDPGILTWAQKAHTRLQKFINQSRAVNGIVTSCVWGPHGSLLGGSGREPLGIRDKEILSASWSHHQQPYLRPWCDHLSLATPIFNRPIKNETPAFLSLSLSLPPLHSLYRLSLSLSLAAAAAVTEQDFAGVFSLFFHL